MLWIIIIFLDVKYVGKIITYTSKVLIMEGSLICDECEKKLQAYHLDKLLDLSDTLIGMYEDNYSFEDIMEDNEPNDKSYFGDYTGYTNSIINRSKQIAQKNKSQVFDFSKIYSNVTRRIIGQDEPIKVILSTIIRNSMTSNPQFKSNIFLIGGTGNGKSETIKQIAKELQIPYVLEDSSKYTQEGYVGDSVENSIVKLINQAGGDIQRAERGIIIFDEIDKKTDNGDRSGVSTTSVQDSLLKMLEGCNIMTNKGMFNTELVTFILIGACEATYKEREKRLGKDKKIGFGNDKKEFKNKEEANPNFIPEDLINSGFKSELIGRMDSIQEFNAMNLDMAIKIIENSELSIFNSYIDELKKLNVKVVLNNREKIVEEIAKRAIELKTGARAIRQIVVEMFKKIYADVLLLDKKPGEVYICYINVETVRDNSKFELCKRKKQV